MGGGGGGGGRGIREARVSELFFTKNPIKKKLFGGGGEVARGMGQSGGWGGVEEG